MKKISDTQPTMNTKTIPIDMPVIRMLGDRYDWDNERSEYLGIEGSCGTYGAGYCSGKWHPLNIPPDHWESQWEDESFDTPEEAIKQSHSYFS